MFLESFFLLGPLVIIASTGRGIGANPRVGSRNMMRAIQRIRKYLSLCRLTKGRVRLSSGLMLSIKVSNLGMYSYLFHYLGVGVPWVTINQVLEIGLAQTTLEGSESYLVFSIWETWVLMAKVQICILEVAHPHPAYHIKIIYRV